MTPLDFARQDIGYTETPINKTKYGEWYGWNGVAWCVQCVQYWFAMPGHELPFKTASSSALANYYKNNEPKYIITSKIGSREYYFLYPIVNGVRGKRIGKVRSPIEFEMTYLKDFFDK